jgi:hypothetical protein
MIRSISMAIFSGLLTLLKYGMVFKPTTFIPLFAGCFEI